MARDNDIIDDIPSIVPERDELVSHRKRPRGNAGQARNYTPEVYVSRTSGAVVFLLSLLFIGMLATGGAGYYFYQQGVALKGELLKASTRIGQLESTLNLVDANASEQLGDIVKKVEDNGTNVANLWAARNVLKKSTEELQGQMKRVQSSLQTVQSTVDDHSKTLANNVTAIQARIDQINKNFAGMDNLGGQLTVLNADLNRVKNNMDALQKSVTTQLKANQEDIESINVYRLQLNQTVAAMQDSINNLQQRLGPAQSAPASP